MAGIEAGATAVAPAAATAAAAAAAAGAGAEAEAEAAEAGAAPGAGAGAAVAPASGELSPAALQRLLGTRALQFVSAAEPASWRPEPRDCVLVTCDEDPELVPDDCFLRQALQARGIRPVVKLWDDETVDWAAVPVLLLRSLWTYARPGRYPDFLRFLTTLQQGPGGRASLRGAEPREDLTNIRWHSHKQYLLDLLAAGVPTVPTLLVRCCAATGHAVTETGSTGPGMDPARWDPAATVRVAPRRDSESPPCEAVRAAAVKLGWGVSAAEGGCVWKPSIGSQGDGVRRVAFPAAAAGSRTAKRARVDQQGAAAGCEDGAAAVAAAVAAGDVDMLLQPFLPLVPKLGELCLVFVRGKFIHAVHKDPAGWNSRRDEPQHGEGGANRSSGGGAGGGGDVPGPLAAVGWDIPAWCAAEFVRQRVRSVEPTAGQLAVATAALAVLPGGIPVLARFDLLPNAVDEWLLSEIEIFGPELFARSHPAVAELAAAEIDRLLPRPQPQTTAMLTNRSRSDSIGSLC
jgi:hypothetical protein